MDLWLFSEKLLFVQPYFASIFCCVSLLVPIRDESVANVRQFRLRAIHSWWFKLKMIDVVMNTYERMLMGPCSLPPRSLCLLPGPVCTQTSLLCSASSPQLVSFACFHLAQQSRYSSTQRWNNWPLAQSWQRLQPHLL